MIRKLVISLLFMSLGVSGCAFFNPISPIVQLGIRWYDGEAQKYYATKQELIHSATKNVLAELKIPIREESVDGNTIYIKAGDDDRFKIKVVGVRDNITKLSIRVNFMGDKPYAEMIYRHVDKQPNIEQFASLVKLNEAMDRQGRRK